MRGDIQRFGARQDLIANSRVEELRRNHVYAPALQESGELAFHAREVETWNVARLKFDQYVNVAVRAEVVAKNRAEQGESLDAVASTECRHGVQIDRDLRAHLLHDTPWLFKSEQFACALKAGGRADASDTAPAVRE
jgi:hypothetical protein